MIIDRIYQWAQIAPTKPAFIYDNDIVVDYLAFAKAIETYRKVLERHDLPAGTVAVVLVSHLGNAWTLVMALRSLGLTTIHVRSVAHAKALAVKNVSCVVTIQREQSAYDVGTNPIIGAKLVTISRQDLAAVQLAELPVALSSSRTSGGHILYTSGTTGAFKKLLWDSDKEDLRIIERSRTIGFDAHTMVHLLNYEQQTAVGWKIPLCAWHAGGCVIMDQRPDRFDRFFRHSVSCTRMTPSVFRQLVNANSGKPKESPNERRFLIGGGSLGAELIKDATAKFGDTFTIYHDHSSTEMNTWSLISRVTSPDHALWLEPTADRTVQVVNESGVECLSGEEGDLRVRTTELDLQGYLDDEAATSKVFRDGFFYPGDRAVRRADGRIRILGRVVDVLNIQGDKIAVGKIEQRIQQILEVDEVCVFSGLNDAGQDEVIIAIQSDREPPQATLDFIRREFKGFETVRFAVLRSFPRTDNGTEKVRRSELRRLISGA
jgi:acyl-coenzyme A synthetase/AMP-(fatty) acid ligase